MLPPPASPSTAVTTPPAPPPTIRGTLSVDDAGHREPVLELSFHCRYCRHRHTHSWPVDTSETFDSFTPQMRAAHCTRLTSPHYGRINGYLIQPARTLDNRRTYTRWVQLVNKSRQTRHKSDTGSYSSAADVSSPTATTPSETPPMASPSKFDQNEFEELCDAIRGAGIAVSQKVSNLRELIIAVESAGAPQRRDRDTGGDLDYNLDADVPYNSAPALMSDGRAARRRVIAKLGRQLTDEESDAVNLILSDGRGVN